MEEFSFSPHVGRQIEDNSHLTETSLIDNGKSYSISWSTNVKQEDCFFFMLNETTHS